MAKKSNYPTLQGLNYLLVWWCCLKPWSLLIIPSRHLSGNWFHGERTDTRLWKSATTFLTVTQKCCEVLVSARLYCQSWLKIHRSVFAAVLAASIRNCFAKFCGKRQIEIKISLLKSMICDDRYVLTYRRTEALRPLCLWLWRTMGHDVMSIWESHSRYLHQNWINQRRHLS